VSELVVTLLSSEGICEARRPRAKHHTEEPWEIAYPWGDDRFYGTRAQVESRMRKRIAAVEAYDVSRMKDRG
jgi:hypothetical protein